jgi:hypothetical protein
MSELPESDRPQIVERRERWARRQTRGSIFWPILLITLGAVFLLRNVGGLSGDAWDNLLRLWPVLLIALGLDSLYRREGVAGAVFWIGLGVVFLLANLGMFAWNVWDVVFNLWPILLIAIGLDIVLGRRSTWGAILAMVLLVAILAGALWFMGGGVPAGQALGGEEISQALGGATEAVVALKPAVGSLRVGALPEGGQALAAGTIRERSGETVRQDYRIEQGRANFGLHTEGVTVFYRPGGSRGPDWDLDLTPAIPLEMQVGLGAGEIVLDLSGLQISRLDVDLGMGRTQITLPSTGQFEADVSGAMGEMVIIVPEGAQVRIESDSGLAAVEAPGSFRRDGNTYTTSGYASASERIDLHVSQAIGKITIRVGR